MNSEDIILIDNYNNIDNTYNSEIIKVSNINTKTKQYSINDRFEELNKKIIFLENNYNKNFINFKNNYNKHLNIINNKLYNIEELYKNNYIIHNTSIENKLNDTINRIDFIQGFIDTIFNHLINKNNIIEDSLKSCNDKIFCLDNKQYLIEKKEQIYNILMEQFNKNYNNNSNLSNDFRNNKKKKD